MINGDCRRISGISEDMRIMRKLKRGTIVLTYIIFLCGWTFRVVFIDLAHMNEYLSWTIGFLIQAAWWPLYAVFFIKRYNKALKVSWKEMTNTKPDLKMLLPLLLFAVIYHIGIFFFDSQGFELEMKPYDFIITVLTVGIFEESVFRGWFLNAIARFTSERRANLISSAMFVLIHYPSWIYHGQDIRAIISTSIPMFGLSLIFGWAFRKSKSIWTGAIFHSFWDMLSFIM
jgi:membrane protease YdiL (CAAX protease family)